MAAHPRAYLLLLPVYYYCLCFIMAPHAAALSFSYNFSANPSDLNDTTNLMYLGDSVPSGDRINLTNAVGNCSKGRVAYLHPVLLWDDGHRKRASFTTTFSFAIGVDDNGNNRGDGMAFFIGPSPPTIPPDSNGSFLGLFNNPSNHWPQPQTVGVEFDTCYTAGVDPPNVTDHIGIDVNNISSTNYTALPNLALAGTMSATVKYEASSNLMSVSLSRADGTNYGVSATVDLKDAGVPQKATVGFSAATGRWVESHQLLSWSFRSEMPKTIELWVIILIAAVAASVAAGFMGALVYYCILKDRQAQIRGRSSTRAGGTQAPAPTRIIERPSDEMNKEVDEENRVKRREKKRKIIKKRRESPSYHLILDPPLAQMEITVNVVRKFSYRQLSVATNKFSEDRVLGEGSFGRVYSGDLRLDRRTRPVPVAVKKMLTSQHKERIQKGYVTEIETLCQIGHRSLVKLLGWCDHGDELLLVYELVANGNLDKHLHGSERLLTWAETLRRWAKISWTKNPQK